MLIQPARFVSVALTLVVVSATPAFAQAQDRRPFRGIFGAPAAPDSPHSLVFTGSLFAAYDDNVVADLARNARSRPWLQKRGTYEGAAAGLDYTFDLQGNRLAFRGHSAAQINYFRHPDRSRALPHYLGDVSFSARLTRSLTFAARQSAAYSENYNSFLAPGGPAGVDAPGSIEDDISLPADPALDLFELRWFRTHSTVSLAQAFGRYLSVMGAYHYRSLDVLDSELEDDALIRFFDYGTHSGSLSIQYGRPVTRYATLNLGYAVRVSDRRSRTGEPEVMHNVNAGVNYARALSFSRRTTLSFGTGTAIAANERQSTPGIDPRTRAHLTGHLALAHEMGRTWTATLTYTRGLRTRDGFDGLYFTDAVRAGLDGLITRRLAFMASASWADSSIQTTVGGHHRGQSAVARLQYALTSYLATYVQYVYHYYRFSDQVVLDPRFPRSLDRQGVRVGVTTSIPLIR